MSVLNKPDMNYGIWAENGNIEIPSSEKVSDGWVIEKPLNEQMNWLQNRSDRMLQYINQRGIPEWDSKTSYPTGAFVAREDSVYQALSPNTDSDPTLNTDIWEYAFVKNRDFKSYADDLRNIKTQDGFLEFYVRKDFPVMNAPTKGVSYGNRDGSSKYGFSGNNPTIIRNNQVVAEFSGGSNPKDVVTHEQLAIAIQNYKVGDIYITTQSGNPSERLGYGEWERFAKGNTLVGFTDEVSNQIPEWVKIAGSEFGEYEHTLSEEEIPKHRHSTPPFTKFSSNAMESGLETQGSGDYDRTGEEYATGAMTGIAWQNAEEKYIGGDKPHNNVQPSIVVYFWKRVA